MPDIVKIKRGSGKPSKLQEGEIAADLDNKKIYVGNKEKSPLDMNLNEEEIKKMITEQNLEHSSMGLKYYGDAGIVPTEQKYFEWIANNDGTCKIISLLDITPKDSDVVIPYKIIGEEGEYIVTSIEAKGVNQFDKAQNVILPNTVENIGTYFMLNSNRISFNIKIPSSVENIAENAFGWTDGYSATEYKFYVEQGSYAEQYAKEKGIMYEYTKINDIISEIDDNPIEGSTNPISSNGVYEALLNKIEYKEGFENEIDTYLGEKGQPILYKITSEVLEENEEDDTIIIKDIEPYYILVIKNGISSMITTKSYSTQIRIDRKNGISIRKNETYMGQSIWSDWSSYITKEEETVKYLNNPNFDIFDTYENYVAIMEIDKNKWDCAKEQLKKNGDLRTESFSEIDQDSSSVLIKVICSDGGIYINQGLIKYAFVKQSFTEMNGDTFVRYLNIKINSDVIIDDDIIDDFITPLNNEENYIENFSEENSYTTQAGWEITYTFKENNSWERVTELEDKMDKTVGQKYICNDIVGEIFNNYEGNQAISEYSSASGNGTLAGCKGYWYSNIDSANKTITLSTTHDENGTTTWDDSIDIDWVAGDVINIVYDSKYYNCATIKTIAGNEITLEDNILDVSGNALNGYSYDDGFDGNTIWVLNKPECGIADIRIGATVEGQDNKALGPYSHTEGRQNISFGQYGHTEGRKNKATYAAHGEGMSNEANGFYCHTEGRQNIVNGESSHAENIGNTVDGDASHGEGQGNKVNGDYSHGEGYNNTVDADTSHVGGNNNNVSGSLHNVNGLSNTVSGEGNTVTGVSNNVSGVNNNVSGAANTVGSDVETMSDVEAGNLVSGYWNNVQGKSNNVSGSNNTVHGGRDNIIGGSNNTLGYDGEDYGTLDTYNNSLSGSGNAVRGGRDNIVSGTNNKLDMTVNSIISGSNNTIWEGNNNTVVGSNNKVNTTTEGAVFGVGNTIELTNHPFVVGTLNHIIDPTNRDNPADCISILGYNNCVLNDSYWGDMATIIGYHSAIVGRRAFVIGAGIGASTDQDDVNRKNIHTVDWDGNAWFAGDIYIGGNTDKYVKNNGTYTPSEISSDETRKKVATEEYINNILSFDESGNLVVTINGVSKKFKPIEE